MNPLFQIGVVTIGASPVALSGLSTASQTPVKKATFFNTGSGTAYVGLASMNISTLANVLAVIPPGGNYSFGYEQQYNGLDWTLLSVHGSHATDLVTITGERAI